MGKEELIKLLLDNLYVELSENDTDYKEYLYFCKKCNTLFAHPADINLNVDQPIHKEDCDNYNDLIQLGSLSYENFQYDIEYAVDELYNIMGSSLCVDIIVS